MPYNSVNSDNRIVRLLKFASLTFEPIICVKNGHIMSEGGGGGKFKFLENMG